jgi:hypothetical protein
MDIPDQKLLNEFQWNLLLEVYPYIPSYLSLLHPHNKERISWRLSFHMDIPDQKLLNTFRWN